MSNELPHALKAATVWLLAGTVIFLGVQWWLHRAQQSRFVMTGESIEIHRGQDGHYHWPGSVSGQEVDFLIDTGATQTTIPARLARELRLVHVGQIQANTAGGIVTGQLVTADIKLAGGVSVQRLRVAALPELNGQPLLGMDVLGRLNWRQGDGVLRFDLRPSGE